MESGNETRTHRLRNQLPYSETGCRDVTRPLTLVVDEYVNRPGVRKRAIYCLSPTHGSRRIIGCPSSFFSCQNLSPRGIMSSTSRASTAFSLDFTMFALT